MTQVSPAKDRTPGPNSGRARPTVPDVLAGGRSKAKSAYNDFLTLWKDADVEIPILKEAKAEFARLQ